MYENYEEKRNFNPFNYPGLTSFFQQLLKIAIIKNIDSFVDLIISILIVSIQLYIKYSKLQFIKMNSENVLVKQENLMYYINDTF